MAETKNPAAAAGNSGKSDDLNPVRENDASGKQVHRTGALNFASHLAVEPSRKASRSTGLKLAGFGEETLKDFRVAIIKLLHRDVSAAARHPAIIFAERDETFGGLRLHDWSGGQISGSRGGGCGA
jgi:hypothetical protein